LVIDDWVVVVVVVVVSNVMMMVGLGVVVRTRPAVR
jgi:hypothetical protein